MGCCFAGFVSCWSAAATRDGPRRKSTPQLSHSLQTTQKILKPALCAAQFHACCMNAVAHSSPFQRWHAPTSPYRPNNTSTVRAGGNRRSPTPTAAVDLRRQLVCSVLQNQSLPAVQGAVLQASHDLVASHPDWQQLLAVFATARAPTAGWGFALRQPGQPRQQKQQQAPPAAGASIPSPPPGWDWRRVQQLRVLGLGSIHALLAEQQSSQRPALPPARLGFRLMQLALAVALQQHLLPGLTSPPTAFDPDFEPADVELLSRLGFAVPPLEPGHAVTGPTLVYMPCCPRHLYSDVLVRSACCAVTWLSVCLSFCPRAERLSMCGEGRAVS